MNIKTPYEIHTDNDHDETIYSPNGIDMIAECKICGLKWLFHGIENPITIYPDLNNKKGERS